MALKILKKLCKNIFLYFWNLSPAISEDVVRHHSSSGLFTVKKKIYKKLFVWYLYLFYYLYTFLFIGRQLVVFCLFYKKGDGRDEDEETFTLTTYVLYDSTAWLFVRLFRTDNKSNVLALLSFLPFPLFALYFHYMFTFKRYNSIFCISHSLAFLNKKNFFTLNPQFSLKWKWKHPIYSIKKTVKLLSFLLNSLSSKNGSLRKVKFYHKHTLPYVHYTLSTKVRVEAVFLSTLLQTFHAFIVFYCGKVANIFL